MWPLVAALYTACTGNHVSVVTGCIGKGIRRGHYSSKLSPVVIANHFWISLWPCKSQCVTCTVKRG
jgi:hypothetical protein